MVSNTRKTFFMIVWNPVTLIMLLGFGVCLLGSNVAERREVAAKIPDVVMTYHNCEYLGEEYVMAAGVVWSYLSTSCGRFDPPYKPPYKKYEWEKGKSYEIQTTHSSTQGDYISKVAPSP